MADSARRLSPATAIIAPEKLRDYVLSPAHPDGRTKAEYLGRIGYTQAQWPRLEEDLRAQILVLEAMRYEPRR